jgi:hypothetical protein
MGVVNLKNVMSAIGEVSDVLNYLLLKSSYLVKATLKGLEIPESMGLIVSKRE